MGLGSSLTHRAGRQRTYVVIRFNKSKHTYLYKFQISQCLMVYVAEGKIPEDIKEMIKLMYNKL